MYRAMLGQCEKNLHGKDGYQCVAGLQRMRATLYSLPFSPWPGSEYHTDNRSCFSNSDVNSGPGRVVANISVNECTLLRSTYLCEVQRRKERGREKRKGGKARREQEGNGRKRKTENKEAGIWKKKKTRSKETNGEKRRKDDIIIISFVNICGKERKSANRQISRHILFLPVTLRYIRTANS